MNPLEYLLTKVIGLFMPLDLIIFVIIIVLFKKIENWGYRILASFGTYLIVSEIIGAIIRGNV